MIFEYQCAKVMTRATHSAWCVTPLTGYVGGLEVEKCILRSWSFLSSISTRAPNSSLLLPLSGTLTRSGPSHRSLLFLSRSRSVHVLPRTRAHSSTWLAGFTCARKRREPTPDVPAARHLHHDVVYSVGSPRRSDSANRREKERKGAIGVG